MANNIFWICMAAYAIHILEEFFYDWKSWAQHTLHLPVEWSGFYITNAAVLFLGIACATVGWSLPWFSLAYPSLMLINAVFFHLLPVIVSRRFSPGLFTALLFFVPLGITCFKQAVVLQVSVQEMLLAVATGIFLMAFPVILLKTRDLPFFKQ